LVRLSNVVAVEQGLVGGLFGREAPAPGSVGIEAAVTQQIAAAGALTEGHIGLGVAVPVEIEVAEVPFIGVPAAQYDGSVMEAAPPLQIQKGRHVRVELRTDQPVLGRRDHLKIRNLEAEAAPLVVARSGYEKAGRALDRR